MEAWTSVLLASPWVRWLHTNTMAVQGATPNRIIPAMYCCASAAGTRPVKTRSKNGTPRAAIENADAGAIDFTAHQASLLHDLEVLRHRRLGEVQFVHNLPRKCTCCGAGSSRSAQSSGEQNAIVKIRYGGLSCV
jgi:hypothetical protein